MEDRDFDRRFERMTSNVDSTSKKVVQVWQMFGCAAIIIALAVAVSLVIFIWRWTA